LKECSPQALAFAVAALYERRHNDEVDFVSGHPAFAAASAE
jgi:hypothetical protein